jgi:hypothetical protein
MTKHVEFALGDVEGLLLERIDRAVRDEETDQVARRPDRQRPEDVTLTRPLGERQLPRQLEQRGSLRAKAKARERGCERGVGQIRFRRYVVTVAS